MPEEFKVWHFENWKPPIFDSDGFAMSHDGKKKYGWKCEHPENLKLGFNVDIGCFTYLNAKYGIEIGDNVGIGSHCSLYSDNASNMEHGQIHIGEGTLIGCHVTILPNVFIHPNSRIHPHKTLRANYRII